MIIRSRDVFVSADSGCDVQARALAKKAAKPEKIKSEKGGHMMWTEVGELGQMIRKGDMKWEDLNLDDIDIRLKWAGLFHRRKRAPGTFMMRLKVRLPMQPVKVDVLYLERQPSDTRTFQLRTTLCVLGTCMHRSALARHEQVRLHA